MSLRYFHAPPGDTAHLTSETSTCAFCGGTGSAFSLKVALDTPWTDEERKHLLGCGTCLASGHFGFFHVTDVGRVDEDGLHHPHRWDQMLSESEAGLRAGAVSDLFHTPGLSSWNEVSWPVHCHDFMCALGSWQPRDFATHNHGRGKDLFLAMTHIREHSSWLDDAGEWGATYFAFQCLGCGEYRGVFDPD